MSSWRIRERGSGEGRKKARRSRSGRSDVTGAEYEDDRLSSCGERRSDTCLLAKQRGFQRGASASRTVYTYALGRIRLPRLARTPRTLQVKKRPRHTKIREDEEDRDDNAGRHPRERRGLTSAALPWTTAVRLRLARIDGTRVTCSSSASASSSSVSFLASSRTFVALPGRATEGITGGW